MNAYLYMTFPSQSDIDTDCDKEKKILYRQTPRSELTVHTYNPVGKGKVRHPMVLKSVPHIA
jgi:hypothetical protein